MTRRSALLAIAAPLTRAAGRTYVVGSTATGAPLSFLDFKTNTLTGAMVDIVKAVADDAGLQIEVRVTAFAALIPSLTSRKIDIISAGMLKTPAREKVVDFSEPVYSYGAALVVPVKDTKNYQRIEDLKSITVGVQVGTRFFEQLQAAGAQVKIYDNLMDMLSDLSVDRIHAAYGDAPILAYELKQLKVQKAHLVTSFRPPSIEDVCLVVRKNEPELLGRINAAVKRTRATKIKAIIDRWGLG
jgi:polar amino acid transport system substrate-binding protein